MKDIKIIISVLCKYLNYLYDMNLKPELFRLAKYNKSDENVVRIFWTLLRKILDIPQSGNPMCDIKHYYLNTLKYKSLHFYSLPEDMSSGSRELLLALAYIIANNHLNNYITNLIKNSVFNPNLQVNSCNTRNITDYTFDLTEVVNDEHFDNMLQWIEGQIRCNNRESEEYQENMQKLLLKRNQLCDPNHKLSYLSELEILALSSEKDCKNFLERSEAVSKVMHLHTKWLTVQQHFWEWMNSVIFEKEKHLKEFNMKELKNFCSTL